ncbi:MAG: 50S ribosomal protein L4 [Candidatus Liptonbacteria bacterium]|nr:50S ribosomal protein L4 [Candidatus Liptonbacteria bacterium]
MTVNLYNLKKEKVGQMALPENIFGLKWNPDLVQQVLNAQLANKRAPWAHAKDRSEVSGGGRKPWRQKGTGRARHGSIRSPIWIGGGKAHGPNKERNYSQKVNKKMSRLALFSVLSEKLRSQGLSVVKDFEIQPLKTKAVFSALKAFLNLAKNSKKLDCLMVPDPENKTLSRFSRNLVKTKVLSPDSLNVYDLLNYQHILIDERAVEIIARHYRLRK